MRTHLLENWQNIRRGWHLIGDTKTIGCPFYMKTDGPTFNVYLGSVMTAHDENVENETGQDKLRDDKKVLGQRAVIP